MSKITPIKSGHGLSGSGLAHPLQTGVTGPGGSFVGRTTPQDIKRTASSYSDGVSGPPVPGNVGIKENRTGGMKRKFAGAVGPGSYTGTK